ncbi:2-hydroxychromene-2-carboxylate isomerase [Candidatus Pelagadaptatus aseana]|uniref:2-hydroxychromene-2-carboxylate isomerase n=1 Tax=Candidatus Pelagadaptatus aseana TaxID=3120508 RepID=UPI003C6EC612
MREITFYFDYVSNNAYLAWTQLHKLIEKHDVTIRPVPILFAGLLNTHGNVGPAEIPAKRDWMLKNILRKCTLLGVPMSPPVHHPFDPLLALRMSSLDFPEDKRWQLIDRIFRAVWVDRLHVSDAEVLARLAEDIGLEGAELVTAAQSEEAKKSLRQQTESAVALGVFGIPSMVWDGELFFGYDDFAFLTLALEGRDPLLQAQLESWQMKNMAASSVRSR